MHTTYLDWTPEQKNLGSVLDAEWKEAQPGLHDRVSTKKFYHYTTAVGVVGVLSSKRIWATHISYVNDASETKYTKKLLLDALDRKKSANAPELYYDLIQTAHLSIDPFGSFLNVYVACFCEEDDLLSQWRGYASQGGGYSIGIETRRFRQAHWHRDGDEYVFRKVIYDVDLQRRLIDSVVDKTFDLLDRETAGISRAEAIPKIARYSQFLREQTTEFFFCFKNPSFKEEREWRLARSVWRDDESEVKYRTHNGLIIPYVELELHPPGNNTTGNFAITSVRCGPNLNPTLSKPSLTMFLRQHEAMVEVLDSGIPLAR